MLIILSPKECMELFILYFQKNSVDFLLVVNFFKEWCQNVCNTLVWIYGFIYKWKKKWPNKTSCTWHMPHQLQQCILALHVLTWLYYLLWKFMYLLSWNQFSLLNRMSVVSFTPSSTPRMDRFTWGIPHPYYHHHQYSNFYHEAGSLHHTIHCFFQIFK